MTYNIAELATFSLYFVVVIAIGWWTYGKNNDLNDYYLGGRSLKSFVTAISANASDSSAWVYLGLPGFAYTTGLSSLWLTVGLTIGFYLSWRFIAGQLRHHTELVTNPQTGKAGNALTLPAYFEYRFKDERHILRVICAILILIFYSVYLASGLVASGDLFNALFNAPEYIGILIGVAVVGLYTVLGGFLAVAYTDVFQGLLMIISIVLVTAVSLWFVGGPSGLVDGIGSYNPDLLSFFAKVGFSDGVWTTVGTVSFVSVISSLAWGFGYFGNPHILARYMGIDSTKSIPKALRFSVTYCGAIMICGTLVGLLAIVQFGPTLDDPERAYLMLISTLFPAWLGGIFLSAILAALMSTASSQLLVASSSITEDFYRAILKRNASQFSLVLVGRISVVGVAAVSTLIAMQGGSVLSLVAYAWAGFASTFGTVIFAALYWRNTNLAGAIAGLVCGGLTVMVYPSLDSIGLYEMIPGVAISLVAIALVSRLSSGATSDMEEEFDAMKVTYGSFES